MQIPYSVCTEISEEGIFWREAEGDRGNIEDIVQLETDKDYRGRNMPGPYTYAAGDTAKGGGIELYGVFEREKQLNDIRKISRTAVQVSESGILVQGILCGHSREECEKDSRVYPAAVGGGSGRRTADDGKFLSPFTGGK